MLSICPVYTQIKVSSGTCGKEKLVCTGLIELLLHHLTDMLPSFQDFDQAGKHLIIGGIHQLARRQSWEAFYELVQQTWVVCVSEWS